jgi:hypothetical protein
VERAVRAVRHARSLCADVEFSTEDGGRSDRAFLVDAIGAVIEAGASTINVPDTVGYTLPGEYGGLFAHLIANVRGAERVVWSTHCHNDLGLATANTLAAVQAGARQVEVTINGLGERAGNTALEEVVMTLATRPHLFAARAAGIDTTQIMRTSKLVSHLTGMAVQANKAVVGANAFAHESGALTLRTTESAPKAPGAESAQTKVGASSRAKGHEAGAASEPPPPSEQLSARRALTTHVGGDVASTASHSSASTACRPSCRPPFGRHAASARLCPCR